ncbi:MAG TPA: M13-type metalloendopeptidase [Terriglobales bacterium]|nr:M13-type metalloendopeptidase [Terriglobales bacterium]
MTVATLDTFPAGLLAAPLFDRSAEDPINFGTLGSVAEHEVTHGFDSMGRKYDASGNLRDWWTPDDAQRYEQRSKYLVDQYSSYVAAEDIKVNGKLTLSENFADGAGAKLAFRAFKDRTHSNSPKSSSFFSRMPLGIAPTLLLNT